MLFWQTCRISALFTFIGTSVANSGAFCANGIGSNWNIGQAVKTTSGSVKGHAASISPSVSEYLGIRYAQPATGKLRFAAPVAYKSNGQISGAAYVREKDDMDLERRQQMLTNS
jgi:hypothetical protein